MTTISKGIKNLFKIEKAKVLLFVLITSVLITSCSKDEPIDSTSSQYQKS